MTKRDQLDLAYLAGVFDGEGSISVARMKRKDRPAIYHTLYIVVTTTDPIQPGAFQSRFGGSYYHFCHSGYNTPRYSWQVAARKAGRVLRELLPYLRLKHEQAELAIEFQRLKSRSPHKLKGNNGRIPRTITPERVELYESFKHKISKLHNKYRSNSGKAETPIPSEAAAEFAERVTT